MVGRICGKDILPQLGMCGIRISVFKNRSRKVKSEISVSVAFLKTELVSYKQSIFEPFSQSFNILHVTDTVGQ